MLDPPEKAVCPPALTVKRALLLVSDSRAMETSSDERGVKKQLGVSSDCRLDQYELERA
jgi:hypothetical protein